ncbi:response regulator [Lachnospiraceae bacterium]|nr:response regulator [Lachnospiraceae bacterium]
MMLNLREREWISIMSQNDISSSRDTLLKVMVVDDEELSRRFIVSSLNWEAFGLEVAAEAASGLEALTLLEEQIPDIIFTDIKMPYMDGLELSRLIAGKYPHIKIVILTAFKDFDYAQQSIQIGVSHFLLKPINHAELHSTILKLKEQIAEEKKKWFELDHLKKILKDNYFFLRERFLFELLEDKISPSASASQLSYYFPEGIPSYIQVTLLEASSPRFLETSEEERLLQDMQNLEFVHKCLKNDTRIEALIDRRHHLVLLSYSPEVKMVTLCEQLQRSIHQISGLDIFFGIGTAYHDFLKINLSWQESLESLKFSRYIPSQSITVYQNDIHVQNTDWQPKQGAIEDIKFYIKAGLSDELNKALPSLYLNEAGNLIEADKARLLSMTLLSAAVNAVNDIGINLQDILEQEATSFLPILSEPTGGMLRNKTTAYLNKLTLSIASYRSTKRKTVLWDIIQYIQKEMSSPELSLSAVAEQFHMNDSYLSRTFKKELGFSFSKYLNRLRMERAIQLITGTDMKAYQVAEAVGIPDAYYFSSCFKKYTGMSIRDYKRNL